MDSHQLKGSIKHFLSVHLTSCFFVSLFYCTCLFYCTYFFYCTPLFYWICLGVYLSSAAPYSSHSSALASVMNTVVTPIPNLFIYSLRNKDIKRALKVFFRMTTIKSPIALNWRKKHNWKISSLTARKWKFWSDCGSRSCSFYFFIQFMWLTWFSLVISLISKSGFSLSQICSQTWIWAIRELVNRIIKNNLFSNNIYSTNCFSYVLIKNIHSLSCVILLLWEN